MFEVRSLVQDGLYQPSIPITTMASTSTVLPLPPLNSPLNPLHCSAVKSTSSLADYLPPSAAFITKFMMKQFCVLFLQWSRYQGQTCSQGTEYTSYDCMNTAVRTCSFTPVVFIHKSLTGWGRMMMRLDADKKWPPGEDPCLTNLQNHQIKSYFYKKHNINIISSSWEVWIYISKPQNGITSTPRNKMGD